MTDIITEHVCPPIPDRNHDWYAQLSYHDADDGGPTGHGATEADTVLDLLTNAVDFDGDGSEQESIVDLAFTAWNAPNTAQSEGVTDDD